MYTEKKQHSKGILPSFNKFIDCCSSDQDDRLQLDTKKQLVVNDFTLIGKSFSIERTKLGKGNNFDNEIHEEHFSSESSCD